MGHKKSSKNSHSDKHSVNSGNKDRIPEILTPVGSLAAIDLATGSVAWVRCFERPQPRRNRLVGAGHWPGGIADAPTVVGDRVIVTDVFGPKLRCLRAGDGDLLWEVKIPGGWRLGVRDNLIYFAGDGTVRGYDLASGDKRVDIALPGEVIGRGFLGPRAAYVPSDAGILRIDPEGEPPVTVVRGEGLLEPPKALVPVGSLVLSCGASAVRLFGSLDALSSELKRAAAGRPSPANALWLVDLARQKGNFTAAEKYLRQATTQADLLLDAERAGLLKQRALFHAVQLYRSWADDLCRRGKPQEGLARLGQAERFSVTTADRMFVAMAMAEQYEQLGDVARAEDLYARVLEEPSTRLSLVPTRTSGLSRPLAAQAELALRRLRSKAGVEPKPLGVRRSDLDRLELRPLAELAWQGPSYVACESGETFAPLVWVRPDGLAAFGPGGQLRWIFQTAPEPDDSLGWLRTTGTLACRLGRSGVFAHELRSGVLRWRWRPSEGRNLHEPPSIQAFAQNDALGRIAAAEAAPVLCERTDLRSGWGEGFSATEKRVIVATVANKGSKPMLHGLDSTTGKEVWQVELPENARLRATVSHEGKVIVVLHASDGRFLLVCLEESAGTRLWEFEDAVPCSRKMKWFCGGGLFVYNDSTGRCVAVSLDDGKPVLRKQIDRRWLPGAAPVAAVGNKVIFVCESGYAAVSIDEGRIAWRIPGSPEVGQTASPAIVRDRIIIWTGNAASAFSIDTGRRLWRRELQGGYKGGYGLLVCNDLAVVYRRKQEEPRLAFLSLETGRILKELPLETEAGLVDVEAIRGGLFVRSGGRLITVVPGDTR